MSQTCNASSPFAATPALGRAYFLSLLALLLLAGAVRGYQLGRMPLWLDEQGQLIVAQTPTLSEALALTSQHGPIGRLSYLDTWVAWHLGATTRALFRLPAAIWGVLAVALTFALGRAWFSANAGLFAAALLAVHGVHIQFSREARGYALSVVLVLLWTLHTTRMLRRFQSWRWWDGALFFVLTFVTVELHPVTMAPLGLLILTLLGCVCVSRLRDAWRTVLLQAVLAAVAVGLVLVSRRDMPVTANLVVEARSLSWHLADIFKALIGGYWGVSSYGIFAAVALGLVCGWLKRETRLCTALLIAVALAATVPIVNAWLNGFYMLTRYSLFAVPFFMIAAGLGLEGLRARARVPERGATWLAPALAVVLLIGMWMQHRSPYDLEREKVSTSWRPVLDR